MMRLAESEADDILTTWGGKGPGFRTWGLKPERKRASEEDSLLESRTLT